MTPFWLFIFEKLCTCTFKQEKAEKLLKNSFLFASWRSMTQKAGIRIRIHIQIRIQIRICQRHGSTDPRQNVMAPQNWLLHRKKDQYKKYLKKVARWLYCRDHVPTTCHSVINEYTSVADPDPHPPDLHVFGPPGSGSTSQRYGYGSFYHRAKIVRKTLIPTILWLFLTFYLWKML